MTIPPNAKKVFSWITFDVYQWEQEMYDWSKKNFEKLKRNDSVDVVAIDKEKNIYILEEIQPWREKFFWLVWWTCEDWEKPLETAKRELLEETWLVSDNWEIFWIYTRSSKIEQKSNIFIAKNCEKIQNQNLDSWEKIKIRLVNWEEFLKIVADPKFRVEEFALEILRALFLWKEKEIKELIVW